ncbi:MAG TPA: cupredoxin domain-containing protein [Gemmatimonadaceae bacterium]|nr:cupredoxin domain-containing protein [Gemmatimonadaceae bacterium]
MPRHQARVWAMFAVLALATATTACTGSRGARAADARSYTPRTRTITITTVPLLVREQQHVFPFLTQDFAKGGALDGKEVYAFSPSTITVVEGDTIHFVFINPEDDIHSFVLPDFAVSLPAQHTTEATYVAKRAGIYPFTCAIQSHLPMMWGQLVVLSSATMATDTTDRRAGAH